jgi:hypothetical protein
MNRVHKWILIAGFFFAFTSCISYSTIELDVLKPASIKIPVEIASVVIVDNAFPYRTEDSVVHIIDLPGHKYSIDTIWVDDFGMRAIHSFAESLKDKQFFDSVHVVPHSFNSIEDGKPMQLLSAYELDTLCRYYNAQAVISLDHYEYGSKLKVRQTPQYHHYATLDANSRTYWKFYNCLSNDLLDVHFQQDTIFWETVSIGMVRSVNNLPRLRDGIKSAAVHAGQKYAKYVAPTWNREKRLYYKKGHPLFLRASDFVLQGEWTKASRIWYHVYEEEDGKQKARAAFNIALAKEVLGDFTEATAWAYRSVKQYEDLWSLAVSAMEKEDAFQYYVELSLRLKEKRKLDEQFGVDETSREL